MNLETLNGSCLRSDGNQVADMKTKDGNSEEVGLFPVQGFQKDVIKISFYQSSI